MKIVQSSVPILPRADLPPVLAVIVDTEEEFDWGRPFSRSEVGVTNIAAQPVMHAIFDRFGIVPTYVIDWPVATTPEAVSVLRELCHAHRCDIGAHLHPWVNPPFEEEVNVPNSFPGNLPHHLELAKLTRLTAAIEDNFGIRPRVYKAGRYGLGPNTMAILEALAYEVDSSVVPHTSFALVSGPDFRPMPDRPFRFGDHGQLFELPVSVGFSGSLARWGATVFPWCESTLGRRFRLAGIAARLGLLERIRLTPEGVSLEEMKRLTRAMLAQGHRVFHFCYHSPSLVPGHTPYVRDQAELDDFLATCDSYFRWFAQQGGQFGTAFEISRRLAETSGKLGGRS